MKVLYRNELLEVHFDFLCEVKMAANGESSFGEPVEKGLEVNEEGKIGEEDEISLSPDDAAEEIRKAELRQKIEKVPLMLIDTSRGSLAAFLPDYTVMYLIKNICADFCKSLLRLTIWIFDSKRRNYCERF